MNNFHGLITPERALTLGDSRSLAVLRQIARIPESACLGCSVQNAWRYLGIGLCFTCATGEMDGSNDFELVQGPILSGFGRETLPEHAPPAGSDRWMQERGFQWEYPEESEPNWRHVRTGVRVHRSPQWNNEEWTRRKIDGAKRAERAGRYRQRGGHAAASFASSTQRAAVLC